VSVEQQVLVDSQGRVWVEQGREERVSVEQGQVLVEQVSVGPVSVDGREQGWVVEQVEDSSFR